MRRTRVKVFTGVLLLAGGLMAQRSAYVGTGPGGSNFGSRSGFGNIVFPGTGRAPGAVLPGPGIDGGFAYRLGATVSGFPAYTGAPAYGRGRGFAMPVAYPIAYPVAYPVYQEPQQPNMTVIYPPPVVINQNFAPEVARPAVIQEIERDGSSDGIRVYQPQARQNPEPAAPASEEKRSYLIALKDHTIYAAFAYWFEGDTLHYVTTHGTHNQASIDRVDRELTERLNRERNVPFRLK